MECHVKVLPRPCSLACLIPELSNEVLYDILPRGASDYKTSNLKLPKSMFLLSKMESLNLQVGAVLMPLEIKGHTIPHLKDLNSGLEP